MRKFLLPVVAAFGIAIGCAPPSPTDKESQPGLPPLPALEFEVEDGKNAGRQFGPDLDNLRGHWFYDPSTGRTNIHVSGQKGDWRVGLDLIVPISQPGSYQTDPSHRGIDRSFFLSLANHITRRREALVAENATVEIRRNPLDPSFLSGQFSGRFAIGARTTGRDILQTPIAERKYARIKSGAFVVPYQDILNGRGRPGPEQPPGAGGTLSPEAERR